MNQRLDQALVWRGLARSRTRAQTMIRSGQVQLDGQTVTKPSVMVTTQTVEVTTSDPYVSRAAHKLLAALAESGQPVHGRVLDAGASTGGFTQVLLEAGAERVYAVDVGHDQLVEPLRADPRVVVREGLNLRDLSLSDLDGRAVNLVVADVSFISLRLLLEPLTSVLVSSGQALLLVKPQFEVGRSSLDRHGVVRDPQRRLEAVANVVQTAQDAGWVLDWQGESRLPGEAGNVEYFIRLIAADHNQDG